MHAETTFRVMGFSRASCTGPLVPQVELAFRNGPCATRNSMNPSLRLGKFMRRQDVSSRKANGPVALHSMPGHKIPAINYSSSTDKAQGWRTEFALTWYSSLESGRSSAFLARYPHVLQSLRTRYLPGQRDLSCHHRSSHIHIHLRLLEEKARHLHFPPSSSRQKTGLSRRLC